MHTNHRYGLRRQSMIDEIELDHRGSFVGIALGTCLYAGIATDASAGIDEKFLDFSYGHDYSQLCADVLRIPCTPEFLKSDPGLQWSTDWRSSAHPSDKE